MGHGKIRQAIENCYITALIYALLCSCIVILRNTGFTDTFSYLYAVNALGMTLLFLSISFAIRRELTAVRISFVFRIASLTCFLAALVWVVMITVGWYQHEITFQFNLGGLIILLAGLGLNLLILIAKTSKVSKELRDSVVRINGSSIRNFITVSVILAYLQLSLLFNIDFMTHLIGILAFSVIMVDQSLNITKWFIAQPRK